MATWVQAKPDLRPRLAARWLITPGVDLGLVIGGALAGYLYLFLNLIAHVPISFLWWFWSVGFDGTHIFGTATRTYFDAQARRRNRALFFGSLAFFFSLGPAMVLAGWKPTLVLIVASWAYYHVVRQHYGFLILYKVKNRDLGKPDDFLDRWFLGVMLMAPPFLRFFMRHPEELRVPRALVFARGEPLLWAVIALTAAVYLARQFQRIRAGDAVNLPKYLLFAGIVPLHWLAFTYMHVAAAIPTVTIVHNLQYHAIIWFHNKNRYSAEDAQAVHGRIPRKVAESLAMYVLLALIFSAAYRVPGSRLGNVSDLAFGFFAGFGLTHYYLDSQIWRVRHDPGLRAALRL